MMDEIPAELRSDAPTTIRDVIEVAASLLALAQIGRGAITSERDARIADLERSAIAALVRGQIAAWDVDVLRDLAWGSPARELAWMCSWRAVEMVGPALRTARVDGLGVVLGARRPRPWDVVRLFLLSVPRLALDKADFASLLAEAQMEVDLCARASFVDTAVTELLAEQRRQTAFAALVPLLAALEAGDHVPDMAAQLRAVADLFEDEPVSLRVAA